MLRWPWSSLSFREPYLAKARGQRTRTAVVNAIFWLLRHRFSAATPVA